MLDMMLFKTGRAHYMIILHNSSKYLLPIIMLECELEGNGAEGMYEATEVAGQAMNSPRLGVGFGLVDGYGTGLGKNPIY